LQKANGTTLLDLFEDKRILNVTLGHVLHMQSGIRDYDDELIQNMTFADPALDISPFDYLHIQNKSLACDPGSCMFYSSINYIIAGFVLAQFSNVSSWEELDQKGFLPEPLRSQFDGTVFAGNGPCSQYPNMSHTYAWNFTVDNRTGTPVYDYKDMFSTSCSNGWTSGNVALTAEAAANYYFSLLGFVCPANRTFCFTLH
jgi:CubicO group peptidase (beta-lactamase class C family)